MTTTKSTPSEYHQSPKWTFVAEFADGVITRMSTFCENGKFDPGRGIALSHAAYESRTGDQQPPAIIRGKFVEPGYDDTIMREFDDTELAEAAQSAAAKIAKSKTSKPKE